MKLRLPLFPSRLRKSDAALIFTSTAGFRPEAYFYYLHGNVPSQIEMGGIDKKRLLNHLKSGNRLVEPAEFSSKVMFEDITLCEYYLRVNRHIDLFFSFGSGVYIYYDPKKITEKFANDLCYEINQFREVPDDHSIHLVTTHSGDLSLQKYPVKKVEIDLSNHYNDDFGVFDQTIKDNLTKNNEKGLIMMHGSPGTGKTTYIRHLISTIERRFIYLPPNLAANISHPGFIPFLSSYPDSVLIIEDAEEILANRNSSGNPAISNLLNLGDGLLSDCLNIRVICTFNTHISRIDPALLRKGRIISKYEFKPLEIPKVKRLFEQKNIDHAVEKTMSLAEIFNLANPSFAEESKKQLGFFAN